MRVRLSWNQLEVALEDEAGKTEMDTGSGYWMTEFFCLDGGYRVTTHKMYYVICWFSVHAFHLTIKVISKKIFFKEKKKISMALLCKILQRKGEYQRQGHFLIFTLNLWCPSKKGDFFFQTKSSAYYALKWKSITFRKCQSIP